jgi:hypothetical protein
MRFIFLWAIITTNATVCCPFMTRHSILADEEAGVNAFDIADALEEVAEFVCKALLPYGAMGAGFDEMGILADVPGDVVDDGANEIDGVQHVTGELPGWMPPYVFSSRVCVAAT